jgi:phosphinothricin acetyltransferase
VTGINAAMGEGIMIVPASVADAGDCARIYAHHVLHGTATFELEPPDAEEMARRIGTTLASGAPWLIAREGKEAVGYAYAGRFHPREAYRFTCEDSIYLAHDRLGRGIGTALLAALIEAATTAGFRQMIAQIVPGQGGSVALHRRFGFTDAGQIRAVGWKHGKWLDVLTMQRALGEGDSKAPNEPS